MARASISDEMVEEEIKSLQDSHYVKLAYRENRVRNRRRQYLYYLRQMEKKGKSLEQQGVTLESLAKVMESEDYCENEYYEKDDE